MTLLMESLLIHSDIIWEEMDLKDHSCEFEYRETNTGDNYGIFDDYYDSRVIYSIDLRSGCRTYYTPIFRGKTQVQ